jgi:5-methylcytosine-specific restriction protein A
MLKQILLRILNEYPIAKEQAFKWHPFAHYIRHDIPSLLQAYFPEQSDLIWDASPGKGQWATAPWIAVFNPLVTESAQTGYYPVFLFTRTLNAIYLSMNQGVTSPRAEFGAATSVDILKHRASILRNRLQIELENSQSFYDDPIDLDASIHDSLLRFYEYGHAFGVKYNANNLPNDEILHNDLALMLDMYRIVTKRGGFVELDTENQVRDPRESYDASVLLDEKRNIRYHKVIERNARLAQKAKEVHGYICQICGFSFHETYGELGKDYIEAHHKVPISKLQEGTTSLSPEKDFAVVCANCHSMIHRKGAPVDFDDFVQLYRSLQDK